MLVWCGKTFTCTRCAECTRSEWETPAPPSWAGRAGQDTVLCGAALVTDSNEAVLELERCQSSTGLRMRKYRTNRHPTGATQGTAGWSASLSHLWRVAVSAEQTTVCAYLLKTCRGPRRLVCLLPLETRAGKVNEKNDSLKCTQIRCQWRHFWILLK